MEHRLWLLSLSTFQVKDILIFHVLIWVGVFFWGGGDFLVFTIFPRGDLFVIRLILKN